MELSEIRTRIDSVDDQILNLFLERMDLAEEVEQDLGARFPHLGFLGR